MIFSELKLRELAGIKKTISTKQILDALNSIGFEVESCQAFTNLADLKFGFVEKVYKNPNSDNLYVCEILFDDKKRIIQTNATNVVINKSVVAFVPGSRKNKTIYSEKILKDIISEGMLASLDELGFPLECIEKKWNDTIYLIDKKIDLKLDPIDYFKLNDNLIDIAILANRSDAMCYQIMAQELAAFFQIDKKENSFKLKTHSASIKNSISFEKFDNCFLNGIEIEYQDEKISEDEYYFLLKNNIKIEDDITNILNLIYLYSGISFRAFDLKKLTTKKLRITNENNLSYLSAKNEKVSLVGITVQDKYKINQKSKKIFVEFSIFDSKLVRTNARATKITNISSINCSRHISTGSMLLAKKYLFSYFKKHSELANLIKETSVEIKFDLEYLNKYVGYDITNEIDYKGALKSLSLAKFKISKTKIISPSYRHDILTMQDIVEEILRFYNIDKIKEIKPNLVSTKILSNPNYVDAFYKLGYFRLNSYSLVSKKDSIFNPFMFKDNISLLTYTSAEHSYFRNSISISLLKIYSENLKRKMDSYHFFDQGYINSESALCFGSDQKNYQQLMLDLEAVFNLDFSIKEFKNELLHPNYSAQIYQNQILVGWIGKFHPRFFANSPIFIEILLDRIKNRKNKFRIYSNLPLKKRDITFSLKQNQSIKEYLEQLNSFEGIYEIREKDIFFINGYKKITLTVLIAEEFIAEFDRKFSSESK